jgi:hypothetical protein
MKLMTRSAAKGHNKHERPVAKGTAAGKNNATTIAIPIDASPFFDR